MSAGRSKEKPVPFPGLRRTCPVDMTRGRRPPPSEGLPGDISDSLYWDGDRTLNRASAKDETARSTKELTEIRGRSKRKAILNLPLTPGHEIAELAVPTFSRSEIGLKGLTRIGAPR